MNIRHVAPSAIEPLEHWIWEFPELAPELPGLFLPAGTVTECLYMGHGMFWQVRLTLNAPLVVVDSRTTKDGRILVNIHTGDWVHGPIRFTEYPHDGDTTLTLRVDLSETHYAQSETSSLTALRHTIRNFVAKLQDTVYA